MQKITPEQANLFRNRWDAVAQVEKEEAQQTTLEDRWRQLNAIFRMAIDLDLVKSSNDSKLEIYSRWVKLKEDYQNDR